MQRKSVSYNAINVLYLLPAQKRINILIQRENLFSNA